MVDLPSEESSQGGLAKQLNQQHFYNQHHLPPSPHIPQVPVLSQPEAGHQAHRGKCKILLDNFIKRLRSL